MNIVNDDDYNSCEMKETHLECNGTNFTFKRNDERDKIVFTLSFNDEWVASASLTKSEDADDDENSLYMLDDIGVSVKYQRKGIGTCFLNEITKYCPSLVVDAEPQALMFYESFGFKPALGDCDKEYLAKIRKWIKDEDVENLEKDWLEYGGIRMYY